MSSRKECENAIDTLNEEESPFPGNHLDTYKDKRVIRPPSFYCP